ncbi:unnamed protein product, partial [marine sediment metagenome]
AGIVQMSGSIAGNTHARNRFGNYIRPRTKPVNPHSDGQENARAIVSYLAEKWHAPIMDPWRGSWNTYAAAVAMKNRLGETIHLTGFNHFIRSNVPKLKVGLSEKHNAPSILSLPEKDHILECTEEDIAKQEFTFICSLNGWEADGDPKYYIFIYQGQPQLKSRNFFDGPWRFMDQINADAGKQGTDDLRASFAFAEGQKVWFQARLLTVSGRLTQRWTLAPKIIVK